MAGLTGWSCIADSLIFDAVVDGWCHGPEDIILRWTLLSIAIDNYVLVVFGTG
jgi:hypothetical protein